MENEPWCTHTDKFELAETVLVHYQFGYAFIEGIDLNLGLVRCLDGLPC